MNSSEYQLHGTTILSVRRGENVVIIGDGQVTLGSSIMKSSAVKVRSIHSTKRDHKVITGFAGATADAFALFGRLESKLETYSFNLQRACVELAKDWRTDKYLRRLEAMIIVADAGSSFILTGTGDVLEPEYDVCAIGSGGNYALSASMALISDANISIQEVARRSMEVASRICIYTSNQFATEIIGDGSV